MKQGLLIIVSGASGTGKGTVCAGLLKSLPELNYSISATTRTPRPGEKDGEDYYFWDKELFEEMLAKDGFLEYAKVFDNYYGTPKEKVETVRRAGQDILLEIDVQGARQVMQRIPEAVSIFILPPSLAELEKRIRGRGTEAEEIIQKRLSEAKREIVAGKGYKYAVVNAEVAEAVAQIQAIIEAERHLTAQNEELFEELA